MKPLVSVVVPSLNEGSNVLDTLDALRRNSSGMETEIIVVDDGSTDDSVGFLRDLHGRGCVRLVESGRLGLARSKNLGARTSRGKYLLFLDAHCFMPPGWLEPMVDAMESSPAIGLIGPAMSHTGDFAMRGCGGTWRDESLETAWLSEVVGTKEIPFQPGGCQMVRRVVFDQIGGYDEGMSCWGSEDVELCLRIWSFGHRVAVQPDSLIYHHFRTRPPYAVDHPQIMYNKLRMIFLHFSGERLNRVLRHQLRYAHVAEALARLYTDDTHERRKWLVQSRVRDMDWLCDRFGLLP